MPDFPSPVAHHVEQEFRPVYRYVLAAQANGVSIDAAWAMWRAVFPKATRSMFRGVWKDVSDA